MMEDTEAPGGLLIGKDSPQATNAQKERASAPVDLRRVKIEESDVGNVLEIDAVLVKARRLVALKEVSRGTFRRIYRPGGRERYAVDRDSGNLLLHHRSELRRLLAVLSQQRKWHHVSGVLSVLLGIPARRSTELAGCWSDFAAAMEVMKRVDPVESNDLRIRRMFRVLGLQQPNARMRAKVRLELSLYLISAGDREAAYDELRPIVDGQYHREDPVANFCHGLNSYYLWYEKCVEDVSIQVVTDIRSGIGNDEFTEGTDENNAEADDQNTYSEWTRTTCRTPGYSFYLGDSRRSGPETQFDQSQTHFQESSATGMEVENNTWQASQRSIYEETDEQGFVQAGEEFWSSVTVPWSSGLDQQLFPIRTQREVDQTKYMVPMKDGRTRDLYAAAVKHLKQALSSAPDMLPALLPLVQLLLATHDIKGAVDEIDKCSKVLKKHFIPPSIKAVLLESLDKKDPIQLAACHRDVLIRNPLSSSSLKRLISLHTSGNLETRSFLECICLHLDVCPGAVETWRKLASCLLEVVEEFQKQTGGDINLEGEKTEEHMEEGLQDPTSLSRDNLNLLWSSRHKWWLRKHFINGVSDSECHPRDDGWLLAYKAACAAHIYSSRVDFVEHACNTLEKQRKYGELDVVEYHCERSLNLFGGE